MLNTPLISIITVVYNGERFLQQTIDSVFNQTYKNIEYIIIDGGSTDGTLSIIKANEHKISKWISEPDKGLYDAMNKGILLAKGSLIGMINSDDWYEHNVVDIMVEAFIANPKNTIFHADRYDVHDDGSKSLKRFNKSSFKFKYYGMTYNHPSMFVAKEEYNKHLYNIKLRALADYQFVLEAYLRDKSTFYYINQPVVNYRLEGISAQMNLKNVLKEGFIARKNAGFNFFQNILSVAIRFSIKKFQLLFYKSIDLLSIIAF